MESPGTVIFSESVKKCCRCKIEKPLSEYWKSQDRCKECCRVYFNDPEYKKRKKESEQRRRPLRPKKADWRKQNPEKYRASYIRYWGNPDVKRRFKSKDLTRRYGISLEQYESMLALQKGACAICKKENSGKKMFHVDHCHATGKIRGLLCNSCNMAIGLFKDNPDIILTAYNYLQ